MNCNNSNNNNEDQIKCRIEQNEINTNKLNGVVAHKYEIQDEISATIAALNSTKTNHTINELICMHGELSSNYNTKREQLMYLEEENERLRNENQKTRDQLNEEEALLEELENVHPSLLMDIQKLKNEFKDTTEMVDELQDKKRLTEAELRDQDQHLICIRNALADKIVYLTQLEKDLNFERIKSGNLISSICELKMKHCKTLKCSEIEITDLQSILNEKSTKLCEIKRKLTNIQEEAETQKYQMTEFKKGIQELREIYFNEKTKAEKGICKLKAKVKTSAADLESMNTKLSIEQIESDKLMCQLKGQEEKIKLLESNKKQLQQEEVTTDTVKTEYEQLDKELKSLERKLKLKNDANDELAKSIIIQNEHLEKLKKQLKDMKLEPSETCSIQDVFKLRQLQTLIDYLLCDKNEDPECQSCETDNLLKCL